MGLRTSWMHPRLKERPMYFIIISCQFLVVSCLGFLDILDGLDIVFYFSRMTDMPGRRLGTLLTGRILTSKVLLSY